MTYFHDSSLNQVNSTPKENSHIRISVSTDKIILLSNTDENKKDNAKLYKQDLISVLSD